MCSDFSSYTLTNNTTALLLVLLLMIFCYTCITIVPPRLSWGAFYDVGDWQSKAKLPILNGAPHTWAEKYNYILGTEY